MIADFLDPPWPLGDDYRVEARIVIWEGRNILKIPAGAVFADRSGRALKQIVEVGHRTPREAEILRIRSSKRCG